MFQFLFKRSKKRKQCTICKNKAVHPRRYVNEHGEAIAVCFKCVEYAERRAFRKS